MLFLYKEILQRTTQNFNLFAKISNFPAGIFSITRIFINIRDRPSTQTVLSEYFQASAPTPVPTNRYHLRIPEFSLKNTENRKNAASGIHCCVLNTIHPIL